MRSINDRCFLNKIVFNKSSLKDDDSGDHDQDQGSPKDSEKEKNEDEDKEQNVSKKKVSSLKTYRKKKNSHVHSNEQYLNYSLYDDVGKLALELEAEVLSC